MNNNLQRINGLGWVTFLDGLRCNTLIGLIFLAIGAELSGLFFFDFISFDIGRASLDFILSVGWLVGLIFLLFHAVYTTAWSDEKMVIQVILSRPFSRAEYIMGVYGGLTLLLLLLNTVLAFIGYIILHAIQQRVGGAYFQEFSGLVYLVSWGGLYLMELMFLAVIVLLSCMVRGRFVVLLLGISYYFICNALPVVRQSTPVDAFGKFTYVRQWVLTFLTAIFPDFSRLDFKDFFFTTKVELSLSYMAVNLTYSLLYVVVMLALSCWIFQSRDLQ